MHGGVMSRGPMAGPWLGGLGVLLVLGMAGCSTVVPAPVQEETPRHGQQAPQTTAAPPSAPAPKESQPYHAPVLPGTVSAWSWPLAHEHGVYSAKSMGLDVVTKNSEPVTAAADGVVSYVGDGISTYGLMAIIKHPDDYVSVYARNSRVLVHQGEVVTRGQKIAETGVADKKHPWHFEIRHGGKALNPKSLIGANKEAPLKAPQ